MLRLRYLSNKYQKRLIRPEYAQTQATPYGIVLDAQFRSAAGALQLPKSGDTAPLNTRTADAFTLNSSLVPGTVMVRTVGEKVGVSSGVAGGSLATAEQPFGLLANFIGGDFDEGFLGDSLQNEVGVWRGPDSTYTLLAPSYNDAGGFSNQQTLTAALAGVSPGQPVLLYAGPDGRLASYSTVGNRIPVARLLDRVSASRIVVDLLV